MSRVGSAIVEGCCCHSRRGVSAGGSACVEGGASGVAVLRASGDLSWHSFAGGSACVDVCFCLCRGLGWVRYRRGVLLPQSQGGFRIPRGVLHLLAGVLPPSRGHLLSKRGRMHAPSGVCASVEGWFCTRRAWGDASGEGRFCLRRGLVLHPSSGLAAAICWLGYACLALSPASALGSALHWWRC